MHSWLVNYTLINIETDERNDYTEVFLTEGQSLSTVEEIVAQLSTYSTYIINEIKYYGYPNQIIKKKSK